MSMEKLKIHTNLNLEILIEIFFLSKPFSVYEKGIPSLKYLPCRNEGILQFLRQNIEIWTNSPIFSRSYEPTQQYFAVQYFLFCFFFISNKNYFQITQLGMRHVKSCIIILNSKSIIYSQYLNWSLLKLLRNISCFILMNVNIYKYLACDFDFFFFK